MAKITNFYSRSPLASPRDWRHHGENNSQDFSSPASANSLVTHHPSPVTPLASTISHNPKKTFTIARDIGATVRRGDVIALVGELGAGKTQFVKGFANGLGYAGEVTSPTFTLIHEYLGGRLPLYHFDFYRLENEAEAVGLGIEEYLLGDGACVIEWADRFPALLPANTRWFDLRILPDERREIAERA